MKSIMLKLAILAFVSLSIIYIADDTLNPFYENFGKSEQVRSNITFALLIAGIAALALLFVRTIIGIALIIAVGVLLFILFQHLYMVP